MHYMEDRYVPDTFPGDPNIEDPQARASARFYNYCLWTERQGQAAQDAFLDDYSESVKLYDSTQPREPVQPKKRLRAQTPPPPPTPKSIKPAKGNNKKRAATMLSAHEARCAAAPHFLRDVQLQLQQGRKPCTDFQFRRVLKHFIEHGYPDEIYADEDEDNDGVVLYK